MITPVEHSFGPAQPRLLRVILVLAISTVFITIIWNHYFRFDWIGQLLGRVGVIAIGIVSLVFIALAMIYRFSRPDPLIARAATACLAIPAYAAALNILTFLGAGLQFPLLDAEFAAMDRALGLDWPGFARWCAEQPLITTYGLKIYSLWFFLAPLILIIHAMARKDMARLERIVGFVVISGLFTVVIGSVLPASSVFEYHGISDEFARRLNSAVDANYAKVYAAMRGATPVSLNDVMHGTVTFPSHHAVIGVMAILYSLHSPRLAMVMLPPSLAMLFVTPALGGHYFIDLVGGAVVALVSWWIVNRLAASSE